VIHRRSIGAPPGSRARPVITRRCHFLARRAAALGASATRRCRSGRLLLGSVTSAERVARVVERDPHRRSATRRCCGRQRCRRGRFRPEVLPHRRHGRRRRRQRRGRLGAAATGQHEEPHPRYRDAGIDREHDSLSPCGSSRSSATPRVAAGPRSPPRRSARSARHGHGLAPRRPPALPFGRGGQKWRRRWAAPGRQETERGRADRRGSYPIARSATRPRGPVPRACWPNRGATPMRRPSVTLSAILPMDPSRSTRRCVLPYRSFTRTAEFRS